MEKKQVTYLDPKYDLTFKRVFAEHKNLCISLINSMLMFEGKKRIVDIEYQTNELIPELPILKNSIVDVRCTDKTGCQFIVEMQMNWTESFKSRVLLNAAKAYVIQLDKAKKIELLQPVYAINLVNHIFETSPEMADEYYHYYKTVNVKHTNKQIKGLEFLFIELPKFKPQGRAEKKLHELWLRFLTEIDENTKEVPAELLADKDISEAIDYMREAAFTKDEKLAYDQNKIDVLTARSLLISAEEARAEGLLEGIEKGEQERLNLKQSLVEKDKRIKKKKKILYFK
jgi:predicted transposase/invertase (TIGR01784 family)